MDIDDFDAPITKAGYCPVCADHANIWAQGKWHCTFCNWEGLLPDYQMQNYAKERLEWRKAW